MKKVSIFLVFCLLCATGFAQIMQGGMYNIEKEKPMPKYQPHAFGIDMSGGIAFSSNTGKINNGVSVGIDVGLFRYTWNFMPYIGWDAIKLKFQSYDGFEMAPTFQGLTGVRFCTPRFGKTKASYGYTAFRIGMAGIIADEFLDDDSNKVGFGFRAAYEAEIGLHFRRLYLFAKWSNTSQMNYLGMGLGVDFGKIVDIKKKK